MFCSARLAHDGKIAAGIIGIIVAVLQVLFGNILGFIVGLLLGIDSIMYLISYKD